MATPVVVDVVPVVPAVAFVVVVVVATAPVVPGAAVVPVVVAAPGFTPKVTDKKKINVIEREKQMSE